MLPRPAAIARVRRTREQKHSSHGQAGHMAVESGDPEMCASMWRGLTWCPVLVKSRGSSLTHCPPRAPAGPLPMGHLGASVA